MMICAIWTWEIKNLALDTMPFARLLKWLCKAIPKDNQLSWMNNSLSIYPSNLYTKCCSLVSSMTLRPENFSMETYPKEATKNLPLQSTWLKTHTNSNKLFLNLKSPSSMKILRSTISNLVKFLKEKWKKKWEKWKDDSYQ
jgi:hypothetical protein